VLVAVMVVVGSALFIAGSLLHLMLAQSSLATSSREVEQSRALVRSGLQAIIAELDAQRDLILEGESPSIEPQYLLFEEEGELGVVRILPAGPSGERLVSEAGKIDINTTDAESLERTERVDSALASEIIAYRDALGRPLQSLAELLFVESLTAEDLYGPLENLSPLDEAQSELGERARWRVSSDREGLRGLADLLTVFSYEPALQRNGVLRINLNVPWSEELGERLRDRFNEEIASGVKQILTDSDFRFESDEKFFELLVFFEPDDPDEWVEYVDAFTFEPHDYLTGRLDLNTAPYESLLSLPEMRPEQARAIVDSREGLDRDLRATVVWPAIDGACETAQYPKFGGRVTNRCWNWRVRLAAGLVDADDPGGPLREPVIVEAVIDLSEPRARVAYFRDITQLQTAGFIAMNVVTDDDPVAERRFDDTRSDLEGADPTPQDDRSAGDLDGRDSSESSSDNSESDDEERSRRADSARRDVDRSAAGSAGGAEDSQSDAPQRVGRFRPGG